MVEQKKGQDFVFIYLTHPGPGREDVLQLARICLERKLIACANVFPPMSSLYIWQGKVSEDQEWAVLFKTRRENFSKLESLVQELHPYDCPCMVALPLVEVAGPFRDWLQSSLPVHTSRSVQE